VQDLDKQFKPVVIGIATVKDQDGAGSEFLLVGDGGLVMLAVGDDPIDGQQSVMIKHQMQLDGNLGALVRRNCAS